MMIITHCHALCGGGTFAYFTQVWQSAEWHYRSKQGNLCNLISANKQPPRNQCGSVTVTGTANLAFYLVALLHFFCFLHCVYCLAVQMFVVFLKVIKSILIRIRDVKSSQISAAHLYKSDEQHFYLVFLSSCLQTYVQVTLRLLVSMSIWQAHIMSSWGHPLWATSADRDRALYSILYIIVIFKV